MRCRWSPLGFRDYTTVRHARRDPVPEPDWDRLRERDAQHTWLMGAACSAWTRRRREWRDPRPDRESGAGRGPRARCRAVPTAHPTDSVRHRRGPQAHSSATLERNYYRTRAAAGRRRIQKCRIPERTRTLPPPRRATNRITGSGISLSRFSRHRIRFSDNNIRLYTTQNILHRRHPSRMLVSYLVSSSYISYVRDARLTSCSRVSRASRTSVANLSSAPTSHAVPRAEPRPMPRPSLRLDARLRLRALNTTHGTHTHRSTCRYGGSPGHASTHAASSHLHLASSHAHHAETHMYRPISTRQSVGEADWRS